MIREFEKPLARAASIYGISLIASALERHTERSAPESKKAEARQEDPPPTDSTAPPTYLCTHCHSTNLEVRYGRSYYFKCLDCDGNTGIKNECRACGGYTRTKKRKLVFSSVCTKCEREEVFFTNAAPG